MADAVRTPPHPNPPPQGRRELSCSSPSARPRILVLKLGALGNVILSLAAFAAIRRHHRQAQISLLTTAPGRPGWPPRPYFDAVLIDERPAWWNLGGWSRLRRQLIAGRFDRVYDLQTSSRSSRYFHLFPRHARPEWSGIAHGCSHPDRNPDRNRLHDIDRQFAQLRAAGVPEILAGRPVLEPAPISPASPCRTRFALLVPGSSAHRPVEALAGAALRRPGRRAADTRHHAGHARVPRGERPGPRRSAPRRPMRST